MVEKDAPRRVRQFQHGPERPLGILHAGAVGLVDDQHVRDLEDAGFDGLDVVAHAGRFHHDGGVRQAGDVHLALSRADGFDDHHVEARRVEDLCHGSGGLRQSAE